MDMVITEIETALTQAVSISRSNPIHRKKVPRPGRVPPRARRKPGAAAETREKRKGEPWPTLPTGYSAAVALQYTRGYTIQYTQ
jgi:hypothetical protein